MESREKYTLPPAVQVQRMDRELAYSLQVPFQAPLVRRHSDGALALTRVSIHGLDQRPSFPLDISPTHHLPQVYTPLFVTPPTPKYQFIRDPPSEAIATQTQLSMPPVSDYSLSKSVKIANIFQSRKFRLLSSLLILGIVVVAAVLASLQPWKNEEVLGKEEEVEVIEVLEPHLPRDNTTINEKGENENIPKSPKLLNQKQSGNASSPQKNRIRSGSKSTPGQPRFLTQP